MVDANSFSDEQAGLQPTSLLEMAQKVHDDFVATGKAKAEALESAAQLKHDELVSSAKEFHDITILEAESSAATIVEDAQLSAFTLISDAKIKADSIINGVQDTKLQLESAILKLQEFEATYRANLTALVSGAQATLAVAEVAANEARLPEAEGAETSAVEGVDFEEVIDRAVHADADTSLVDAVRDVETVPKLANDQEDDADNTEFGDSVEDDVTSSESEEPVEPATVIPNDDVSDEDTGSDTEKETTEQDAESDDDEANSTNSDEESLTLEETPSNENKSPIYYNPLATKPEIEEATVASILSKSGLDTSDEKPGTIITGKPGWGKTTPIVQSEANERDSDVEHKEEK